MCFGAIYWAHLDKIYYANDRKDSADIGFELHENSLQKSITWGYIVCRRQVDIASKYIYHVVYPPL